MATKKSEVVITVNSKQPVAALKAMKAALKQSEQALNSLVAAGKGASKKAQDLRKEQRELTAAIKESEKAVNGVTTVIKDLSSATTSQLRRALREVKKEIENTSASSGKLKGLRDQMAAIQNQIDANTGALKKQGNAFESLIKHGAQMMAMYTGFNAVKNTIEGIYSSNIKLTDQLANIRKVSGLMSNEVRSVSEQIMKIQTRTSVEQLNNLAYIGSKLGIAAKYGIDGLVGFTRAADQLNVALKEDMGDDALNQVAKMTQVMGDMQRLGVEKALLSTSSAIFKLSASTTSNGANIVQFAERLVGLGKASRISTPDILAFGSAVDSMMLKPEVAATAMSKFITSMQTNYNVIEQNLQIAPGTLKSLLEANQIVEAMTIVFDRMNQMGNMNALNFMFKDMGSDGARLKNVMITMAQNTDILREHLQLANSAFKEGSAVTMEYVIQQNSAAALMERASNEWKKMAANAANAEGPVKELAQAWFNFSQSIANNSTAMGSLTAILTLITKAVELLLSAIVPLAVFFTTRWVVSMKQAITAGHGLAGAIVNLRTSFKSLMATLKANVWAMLAVSIYNVIALLGQENKFTKEAEDRTKALNRAKSELNKELAQEKNNMLQLYRGMTDTNKTLLQRQSIMAQFNSKYGMYLGYQLKDVENTQKLAEAYNEAQKEMARYLKYKAMAQVRDVVVGQPKINAESEFLNAKAHDTNLEGLSTSDFEMLVNMAMNNIDPATGKNAFKTADDIAKWIMETNPFGLVGGTSEYNRSGIELFGRQWTLAIQNGAANASDILTHAVEQMMTSIEGQQALDSDNTWKDVLNYIPPVAEYQEFNDITTPEMPEDDARANIKEFITKITNFYERQMTAATEQMTANNIEEAAQEVVIRNIKSKMREALSVAQQALVLGSETWDTFKESMDKDIKEKTDEYGQSQSLSLLDAIQSADTKQLRADLLKQMPKIKKGKITGLKSDERDRAYLDQMWLEASSNEYKNAKAESSVAEARRKELLENNYTGVLQQSTYEGLLKTGFVNMDPLSGSYAQDKQYVIDILEKARKNISEIYSMQGDYKGIMSLLFGNYEYTLASSPFKSLLEVSMKDFQLFYNALLKYDDDYNKALRKQSEEREKILKTKWEHDRSRLTLEQKMEQAATKNSLFGSEQSISSSLGLANPEEDYNVQVIRMRLEMAQKWLEFVKQFSNDELIIQDAEKKLREAEAENMKTEADILRKRAESLQSFMKPAYDAVESMGEVWSAYAKSSSDGQKALLDNLRNFIKQYAKMLLQAFDNKAQQKITNNIIKKDLKEKYGFNPDGEVDKGPDFKKKTKRFSLSSISLPFGKKKSTASDSTEQPTENSPIEIQKRELTEMAKQAQFFHDYMLSNEADYQEMLNKIRENPEGREAILADYEKRLTDESKFSAGIIGVRQKGFESLQSMSLDDWKSLLGDDSLGAPTDNNDIVSVPEALSEEDNKLFEATRTFHVRMLEEETLYQEMLQKLRENPENKDAILNEYEDRINAEKHYSDVMMAIRSNSFANLRKISVKGWGSILKNETEAQEQKVDVAETTEGAVTDITKQNDSERLASQMTTQNASLQSFTQKTIGDVLLGIAGGSAKTVGELGWWGLPLVGVLSAALMGLLDFALSKIGGGGSNKSATNTKIVSGMLTYDNGNLSQFVGNDGRVYTARDAGSLPSGVSMISSPIATTVNGQPSLVAERGPELVVGRETTAAMQQNNPGLLKALFAFDRNRTKSRMLYDNGNLASMSAISYDNGVDMTGVLTQLTVAITALQQNGVKAKMDMWGHDGAYESLQRANSFMKGK